MADAISQLSDMAAAGLSIAVASGCVLGATIAFFRSWF